MSVKNRKNLIIISGGGTGGPSTAPLALAQAYAQIDSQAKFVFFGSNSSLEKGLFSQIFEDLKMSYLELPAGKWRRYFSVLNFFDLFKIFYAFFKALWLLINLRPALIISAGSFASVPVVWAAKMLGIKVMIHQQDLRPGLANRLMAPVASLVTVSFEQSLLDYGKKAVWIGNPLLKNNFLKSLDGVDGTDFSSNDKKKPLLFLSGGASGSMALNRLLIEALPHIPSNWQIVHQTGKGKKVEVLERDNYQAVENFSHAEFFTWSEKADVIISRAGLSSLTEFSYLGKTLILIPMPNTHQEDNALYFSKKGAALYLKQKELDGEKLAAALLTLWQDDKQRQDMEENIRKIMPAQAAQEGAKLIQRIIYESS